MLGCAGWIGNLDKVLHVQLRANLGPYYQERLHSSPGQPQLQVSFPSNHQIVSWWSIVCMLTSTLISFLLMLMVLWLCDIRACGRVVCSMCAPKGDTVAGDGEQRFFNSIAEIYAHEWHCRLCIIILRCWQNGNPPGLQSFTSFYRWVAEQSMHSYHRLLFSNYISSLYRSCE